MEEGQRLEPVLIDRMLTHFRRIGLNVTHSSARSYVINYRKKYDIIVSSDGSLTFNSGHLKFFLPTLADSIPLEVKSRHSKHSASTLIPSPGHLIQCFLQAHAYQTEHAAYLTANGSDTYLHIVRVDRSILHEILDFSYTTSDFLRKLFTLAELKKEACLLRKHLYARQKFSVVFSLKINHT